MKQLRFLVPLVFISAFFSCQSREKKHLTYAQAENAPPLVIYTSLDDTLPKKSVQSLNLPQRVLGTKVKYMTGHYASYFVYDADGEDVLSMIANLPFSMNAVTADTTCLRMDRHHLELIREKISAQEYENAAAFWSAGDDFEIYACSKYPYMHTVLINRKSNKVLHRIDYHV
jgi:hypothetical protein